MALMRFKTGDSLHKVCNAKNLNTMANIIEGFRVMGVNGVTANLDKSGGERAWTLTISGNGGGGGTVPTPGARKVLASSGTEANTDSWQRGETSGGELTAPSFVPFRAVWDGANHRLVAFARQVSYDASGALQSVSAETETVLLTTVQEMP